MTDAPPLGDFSVGCSPDAIVELSRFVDVAPDPMALVSAEWRILFANARLCTLLGRSLASLIGADAGDLLDSRDRRYADARVREELGLPVEGPVSDQESVTAVRGDGARVPVTVSISRLDGQYRGLLLTTIRDVTTDLEIESRAGEIARLYAMLASANAAILRSQSRSEVYDELCRVTTENGDFRMAWVAVGAEGSECLTPVAVSGPALVATFERSTAVAAPMAEKAWRTGQLVVVQDIGLDPLTTIHRDSSARARTRSGCAIPIRCRGEVVAVFATYMERAGGYDRRRLELLERLVDDVSFALGAIHDRERKEAARDAQALTEQHLAVRMQMQAELSRLGRYAMTVASLDELYERMVHATRDVLDADVAIVKRILDPERAEVLAQAGLPDDLAASTVEPGQAIRTLKVFGAPVVTCSPAGYDGPLLTTDPRCEWAAAVQIPGPDDRTDALAVGYRTERHLARDELDFLQTVASIAAATADRLKANHHLRTLAYQDHLTGLPNRLMLFDAIKRASGTCRPGHAIAVLLIDLDGFKDVNDALGHDVGDQLLIAVAARLQTTVSTSALIARLGGDEFAVLQSDVPSVDTAIGMAEEISRALDEPFVLDGLEMFISSSIGITVRTTGDADVRALLREADAALYAAKDSGRARWELYDDAMRHRAVERLELSNALRQAVDTDQFELVWQPVVPLQDLGPGTRAVLEPELRRSRLSFEALLRWEHPTLGRVAPDRFIALAEETGLIVPIGELVIRRAFEQLATWQASHPDAAPDMIAVNLSARQLAQRDLVDVVRHALRDSDVDPRRIAFEITETAVLADPTTSIQTLAQLRELGLHIAIDDFGTGYSSLAYLRDLPADALKIDRSFISRLGSGRGDDEIVESVIALAHAFDLVVVGEGVETPQQRDALVRMGCDRGQGYLWARPLNTDEVPAWIKGFEQR